MPEAKKLDTTAVELRISQLAGDDHGVLSVPELRSCGLTDNAIFVRAHNGRLHWMHQGVYAVGHPNVPLEGRFLAAVKACGPTAVLSHFSAAALWGFFDWDDRHPEVTVLGTGARKHKGISVHRTRTLSAHDTRHHQAIPLTAPARTLIDLAGALPPRALRRLIRQALGLNLLTVPVLLAALERTGPRKGTKALRKLLATGVAPTRSELEDIVLELILRGGLARPEVNVPMTLNGRRVVPDFRWPDIQLVVEADSAAWHDDPLARADDAERQALLEAHGERVLRVTWAQAISRPAQTLARIRAAGALGG